MMSMKEFVHFGISNRLVNKNIVTNKETIIYMVQAFCGNKTATHENVSNKWADIKYRCPKCSQLAESINNKLEYIELKRLVRGD